MQNSLKIKTLEGWVPSNYFRTLWFFLIILLFFFSANTYAAIRLSQMPIFSSLLEQRSDPNCMAFNTNGDLYYIGSQSNLEMVPAAELPDGEPQVIVEMADFSPFLGPGATSVSNINGCSIAFDSQGRVIAFIEGISAGTRISANLVLSAAMWMDRTLRHFP